VGYLSKKGKSYYDFHNLFLKRKKVNKDVNSLFINF
jgi:hypothetical protein